MLAQHDPAEINWGELGTDMVIESTGRVRAKVDTARASRRRRAGRYVREGAVGLGAAVVALLVAETAQAGLPVVIVSCLGICVLAVLTAEIPGMVMRRVEVWKLVVLAEVAARLRERRKQQAASPEVTVDACVLGAQAPAVGELRYLADAGRALQARLTDCGGIEARLGDGEARAVAFWERRARFALRCHGIEWAAFDGAAKQNGLAVTVGGAKDRMAAHVRLLVLLADNLDDNDRVPAATAGGLTLAGPQFVQHALGEFGQTGADGLRHVLAVADVRGFDGEYDESLRHPVHNQPQVDGLADAEPMRARRPWRSRPPSQRAVGDAMPLDLAGHSPVLARRIDHDREPGSRPGLEQPARLPVRDDHRHAGQEKFADGGRERRADAVIAAIRVPDADQHNTAIRAHRRSTCSSRK